MPPSYRYPDPDRDYMNAAFIPEGESYVARWRDAAASFRQILGARADLDQSYGAGARHRFDSFHPEGLSKGVVIFVHGGFWLNFGREHWSHLAAGPVARGWTVVMPSYTLAPEARISEMTREIAEVTRLISARCEGPLVLTGHSAGGHLAARMGCGDFSLPVARVLPISPLSELAALIPTEMNQRLRIDEGEAAIESPARLRLRAGISAHIWCGAEERPAFLWQSRTLAEEWACPATFEAGRHHFDICDGLMEAGSPLTNALLAL